MDVRSVYLQRTRGKSRRVSASQKRDKVKELLRREGSKVKEPTRWKEMRIPQ